MKQPHRIKIIFVLPSLVAGGAERVMSFIAQNLTKEKFDTTLLVAGSEKDNAYDIKGIDVIYLNKSKVRHAVPYFFYYFIKLRPHIVFSCMSHLITAISLISSFFRKTKFIGREAIVLSLNNEVKGNKTKRFNIAMLKRGYKKLDCLICQSKDMEIDLISNFDVPPHLTRVINNPISSLPPVKNSLNDTGIKHFITVARLSIEKGHSRILQILAKLNFDFTYTIIGNGNEKENIFSEAKKLGIYDKINYIPFTNNVSNFLVDHDIYLQGAYVEGFPNSVLESCVVGTPVYAFNAPGTREIVRNNINGFLVENEEEFINCLNKEIVWNPKDIRESVYKRFNKEKILKEYENLFINILNN